MDRVLLLFLCLLAQWIYQVSNFKSSFVSITFSSKHISTFSSKTRYPHAHLHIVVSFQFQIHSSLNITAGHFPRQSDNLIQSKHGFILSYSERLSRLNSNARATLTPLWFKVIPQSVTPCLHLHLTHGLNAVVRSELRADERRWYHGKPTKSLVNLSNREQATRGATPISILHRLHGFRPYLKEGLTSWPRPRHHWPWFRDVCLMAQTNNILLKLNTDGVINVGVSLMKYCWMEDVCTMKYSDNNTLRPSSSFQSLKNANFNI